MTCERCNATVKRTLADNTVSRIGRYKTAAYYCDACDRIFIIDNYKSMLDPHKFDGELPWLREQNPNLNNSGD